MIHTPNTTPNPLRHIHRLVPKLLCAFLLVIPTLASAVPVTHSVAVRWNPNPEPDIAGYKVHLGTSSRTYTSVQNVTGGTRAVLSGLAAGIEYYCAVQAYNAVGLTSELSEEISFTIPSKPQRPEIVVLLPSGKTLADGASKSFGSVALKSVVTKTFTIRNTGGAVLKNLAIRKTGENPGNFTVKPPRKTTLRPGESTTLKVTFRPSAKGPRKAVIHIRSNDGNESPFDIALTGKGTAAKTAATMMSAWVSSDEAAETTASATSTIRIDGLEYRCITVRKNGNRTPGQEAVEVSSDLVDWLSGPKHTTVVRETADVLKVRDNTPVTPGNKRFIRLRTRR